MVVCLPGCLLAWLVVLLVCPILVVVVVVVVTPAVVVVVAGIKPPKHKLSIMSIGTWNANENN